MVFANEASSWFEAGYNVLPLAKNGKMPVISGWQEWGRIKQAEFQIESWCNSYASGNIGFPLGECNAIVALDFDYDCDGLHEKIIAMIPPSPVRKLGAKGFTSFYKYNGERNKRYRKNGETIMEILSTGTQTVLPPSIHPDTEKPYKWLTEDTLLDYKASELPSLPREFIQDMNKLFGIERKIVEYQISDTPELETVRHALQFVPSSEYSIWIEVGMALNHSYGDAAFDLWDRWSATAFNYDGKNIEYKWNSFGKYKAQPVSAATVLHYAMQYGWLPETAPRIMNSDAVITIGAKKETPSEESASIVKKGDVAQTKKQNQIDYSETGSIPQHLLDAPNLVGELTDWINGTSIRYQPSLSIGASLGAIGTLMAHRFRTPTDLRSNIYSVGICGAGLGKDHARKCVNMIFDELHIGQYLMGDFASDTAIISALSARQGIGFSMNDEIGDMIASISGRSAGSYEMRIMRLTKELFSSSNTVFRGKEYANHDGKMEAKVINQPCLSVYGTSTPGQFFDTLNGKKVLYGFLPRWLVFEGDGYAQKMERAGMTIEAPKSLLESAHVILDASPYETSGGLSVGKIKPSIVDVTDGARDKIKQLEQWAESMRIAEYEKKSGLDALYSRAVEHAWKLSLVAHKDKMINGMVAAWACELVMFICQRMASLANERIGDNDYERDYLSICEFVKQKGDKGASRRDIVQKFRRLEVKQINNLLAHISESGMLEAEEFTAPNGKKTHKFYSR